MADVSLTTLRARVREAADQVGSSFVTDTATSMDAWINGAAHELYKLLVSKFEDYFELTEAAIALVAGTEKYLIANDFLKLRGVDVQVGSEWKSIGPVSFTRRNVAPQGVAIDPRLLGYRLEGKKLVFSPKPAAAGVARALYIPQFVPYDTAAPAGAREWYDWDDYIVQVAAAHVAVKEETDPSPFMAEAARLRARIEEEAKTRDATEPGSVGDASDNALEDPWLLR